MIAFVALAVSGSAAAAIISASRSRPLNGGLPAITFAGKVRLPPSNYRVTLFPFLAVGFSGWCSRAEFVSHGRQLEEGNYSCGSVETSGYPVLASGQFGFTGTEFDYEIVTDQVRAVRFAGGTTITPIRSPGLPTGTRGMVYVAQHKPLSSPAEVRELAPMNIDQSGRVIPHRDVTSVEAVEHLPLRAVNPAHPTGEPCGLDLRPAATIHALSQTVATPAPWPRRQPGAFLSCSNATYRVNGATLVAAVLVDAQNDRRQPAALPEVAADPSHTGLFISTDTASFSLPFYYRGVILGSEHLHAPLSNLDVTARRQGTAWIVVLGGSPADRRQLQAVLTTPI